jgi:Cytochrome C oxidase copper chaperone (COX17).
VQSNSETQPIIYAMVTSTFYKVKKKSVIRSSVDIIINLILIVLTNMCKFVFSIIENGEENCKSYIEAHKECMRKMGFNI